MINRAIGAAHRQIQHRHIIVQAHIIRRALEVGLVADDIFTKHFLSEFGEQHIEILA